MIWFAFFAYAASLALLLQFVVVPHLPAANNGGHGLMEPYDFTGFHANATKMVDAIHQRGWSAWELRPLDQGPVGMTALIYALSWPEPWALIPVHASLHALAGLMLVMILERFVASRRVAVLCVLPFVLFPSALAWYGQIHREPYVIPGYFLFLWGWLRLLGSPAELRSNKSANRGLLSIACGATLVWIMRPYASDFLRVYGAVFVMVAIVVWGRRRLTRACDQSQLVRGVTYSVAAFVFLWVLSQGPKIEKAFGPSGPIVTKISTVVGFLQHVPKGPRGVQEALPMKEWLPGGAPAKALPQPVPVVAPLPPPPPPPDIFAQSPEWQTTWWLPRSVDETFLIIAKKRNGFCNSFPDARTAVDEDIRFHSAADVIRHIPRALQLALFAPFPTQWFEGSDRGRPSAVSSWKRRAGAFEMVIVDFALLFFPLALWSQRKRANMWVLISFCTGMLMVHAFVINNIGTLYRFRYPFLMTFVAFGLAEFYAIVARKRTRKGVESNVDCDSFLGSSYLHSPKERPSVTSR